MLVLTRRKNESIVIGNVTVTVLQIIGGQVRIGIEAPKEVTILRSEVKQRMEDEADGR